jgi:zinc transporter
VSQQQPDIEPVQPRPMPTFLSEPFGADRGLICGFKLRAGAAPQEIPAEETAQALSQTDAVVWLHFNLSDARARRWLLDASFLPESLRELWRDHDGNRRVEIVDDGLLLVVSDFAYDDASDPSEVAPLWCFAGRQLLITARVHPLRSADEMRLQMRSQFSATSGVDLVSQLLDIRSGRVKLLSSEMTAQLDEIEDKILAGNIEQQRELLGRSRRLCARLRRQFAPERSDLNRFLHRPTTALSPAVRPRSPRSSGDVCCKESRRSSARVVACVYDTCMRLVRRHRVTKTTLHSRVTSCH